MTIRASLAIAAATVCSAGLAASQAFPFPPGTVVLASPMQMEGYWSRCEVIEVPVGYAGYQLECADEYRSTNGSMTKTLHKISAPAKWVKADDPAFRPDMNVAAIRSGIAKAAAPKTTTPAPAPAAPAVRRTAVPVGSYECWAFSAARMTLNFTILDQSRYRASDGSIGRFTFNPADSRISFTGYLKAALPAGYVTVYREPQGLPTVSFRNATDSEVSFCELVKR